MGKFIYMMTFVASLSPQYQEAADQSRRALLETDMMKKEMAKFHEDTDVKLYEYTGLKEDDFAYAVYAYPLIAGKISTKPIKELKYETEGHWVIRPEVEWTFSNGNVTEALVLIKEF